MDREQIEKFRRHMGGSRKYIIKSSNGVEDEFEFHPLSVQYLPDFMLLSSVTGLTESEKQHLKTLEREGDKEKIESYKSECEERANMRMLEKENMTLIITLIDKMVKKSYPDLSDDDRSAFILNNVMPLIGILTDLHSDLGSQEIDPRIAKRIEQIKQNRNAAK